MRKRDTDLWRWGMYYARVVLLLAATICASNVHSQRRHKGSPAAPHTPKVKKDILTLRYKPQAGTLLYTILTSIGQSIRSNGKDYNGVLRSNAQLAFHNIAIDYKKGIWTFDEYFTKFDLTDKALLGDSVSFREALAVDRVTELTFDMKGDQLARKIVDTLKLLNAEAQTDAYFLQPPRMLIPLPEHAVTYGDEWTDHRRDSIMVRDTINLGVTSGQYVYDLSWKYHFAGFADTSNPFLAVIVASDSGTFSGFQENSETKVRTLVSGPITGTDSTILDLFTGTVQKRTIDLTIPAQVAVGTSPPLLDTLHVRSEVKLDESNARVLKNN